MTPFSSRLAFPFEPRPSFARCLVVDKECSFVCGSAVPAPATPSGLAAMACCVFGLLRVAMALHLNERVAQGGSRIGWTAI
ncbi:hypothetical protein EJ04DRAFT_362245 [Polyplosphaeria fusca]|uniref:Uncharacterized protein n=1 Tax=Polyplosphaeria fusca TaxID=682080 RepID=A0A9P4V074_9PLEO|nr:hypothetical protein EJ04DRAFT_362245 [Polyplosphaeria fusca]